MTDNTPAEVSAHIYDDYVHKFTKPWNDYIIKRILEEVNHMSNPPNKILDVGTGSARTLIMLAEYKEISDSILIGLDFFSEMIVEAKENVKRNCLTDRIQIKEGDIHQLPFIDNSIDLIFARSVIHHWANPIKAYKEIYRVLTPQGVCIIHEPSRTPSAQGLAQFNQLREAFGIGHMQQDEKYTPEEIREQIKLAGLEEFAQVNTGTGFASLGFEVRFQKHIKAG